MNALHHAADRSQLAAWRWRDGLLGVLTGLLTTAAVVMLRAQWLAWAQGIVSFWHSHMGLPPLSGISASPPSGALVLGTTAAVALIWTVSGTWPEHRWPLRAVLRGLCLVQASACLFFALVPAQFPYTLNQHLDALWMQGSQFLVFVPLMLCMGWGVLRLPWALKLLAPGMVVLYFALLLPHQLAVHAWVLVQGSALFMPLLFLCFGL